MLTYTTVSEAVNDLHQRGFTADFSFEDDHLNCAALTLKLHPHEFEVVETHRFEGPSDPADSSVVYAIESHGGVRGVMVNAYGIYAESTSAELVKKLG